MYSSLAAIRMPVAEGMTLIQRCPRSGQAAWASFHRPIRGLVGFAAVSSHAGCRRVAVTATCLLRSNSTSVVTAQGARYEELVAVLAWCFLFVLCWPLALLALVLWPIAWLLALPFRLVGITFSAIFAFLQAILFVPAAAA